MNLNNAIERLRNVVRRQHKALSTEDAYMKAQATAHAHLFPKRAWPHPA
jgi:hypothetical protein